MKKNRSTDLLQVLPDTVMHCLTEEMDEYRSKGHFSLLLPSRVVLYTSKFPGTVEHSK